MKIKPAKLAAKGVNIALIPVNAGITAVNLAIRFWPLVWMYLRGAARMPKRAWVFRKEMQRIGLYQFTDCSRQGRQFNILLMDSRMEAVNQADNSAIRQGILDELRHAVAADSRCPDFQIPEMYQWNHPSLGFKKVERLRDASRTERKSYLGSPVREIPVAYADYVRGY